MAPNLSTAGLVRQGLFLGTGLTLGVIIYLSAAWGLGLDEVRILGGLVWRRAWRMVTV